jgi:hypothetical protein
MEYIITLINQHGIYETTYRKVSSTNGVLMDYKQIS